MGFRHYTRHNRCPVCGSDHYCGYADEGRVVNCTHVLRNPRDAARPAPGGYELWKPCKGTHGGMLYRQLGPDGKPLAGDGVIDDKKIEEEEARKAAYRLKMVERAGRMWQEVVDGPQEGRDHPRVRAYLEARGIPVERLPGGVVPDALRFHPRCLDDWDAERKVWRRCPAMVARTIDATGKGQGLHATYLDPAGTARKRSAELGKPKRMVGPMSGCAIRLGRDRTAGALCLTEGIENALTVMVATGLPAWACGSAEHMMLLKLHPGMFAPAGPIHTLILCGDRNKNEAGQRACGVLANIVKSLHPQVQVYERFPGPQDAPGAFSGAELAVKGVDWNDAAQATGLERVRASILEGIDLARNAREVGEAILPPAASPAMSGGGDGEGVEGGTRAAGTFGGSGGFEDAGAGHAHVGEGDGGGGGAVGVGDGELDPERMPVIPEGDLNRARLWLLRNAYMRGAGRFGLARWGGKWWMYLRSRYVEVSAERLHASVLHWLNGFSTVRELKSRVERRALNPSAETAEVMVKALVTDTHVDGKTMPRWLTPVVGADGRPMWGDAVAARHLVDPEADVDRAAGAQICVANGRLDLHEIIRTDRVELKPHTPNLFNTVSLPFDVDVERLQAIIEGGDQERILADMCPTWFQYLDHASGGIPRWKKQKQLMFGDVISGDRSGQWLFFFVGARNAGKTTTETALKSILGVGNYAAVSIGGLGTEFGLAPLVGKPAAIVSDAQMRRFSDADSIIEMLKTISGQGAVPVRDIYEKAQTCVLGCRFCIFCNEVPDLRDDSGGFGRRMIVLPYTSPIRNADPAAMERIADEAPGILLWAMAGAVELARMERRTIAMCDAGADAVDEYNKQGAQIPAFVEECLEERQIDCTTPEELYATYVRWCEKQKREPMGEPRFFKGVRWQLGPAYRYSQPRGEGGQRRRIVKGWGIRTAWAGGMITIP